MSLKRNLGLVSFEFYFNKKKVNLDVKECKSILSKTLGLMFRRKSEPLLFIFSKEKTLAIHSFFCQSFIAIWISSSGKIVKIEKITRWRPNFSAKGKYLLEVPSSDESYLRMTKIFNLSDEKK
jgi:uncharacterized membrane protein (UPF0127 family)